MCRISTFVIVAVSLIMASIGLSSSAAALDREKASSGKTQIVAKLSDREITISDLRSEMARLGLSANDPSAEPVALQSIVQRAMLADAAREAGLDRQPEALRQMARAQEQALADIYLATTAQPPEPTRDEIDDFIAANPEVFAERRIYTFSVLTMPAGNFSEEDLTPLFDETVDFKALADRLDRNRVAYEITPAVQPSDAFPDAIRKQLAAYRERDNIVIQSEEKAQIMKIVAIKDAPLKRADAPAIARRALLAQNASKRAESLIESLKRSSSIAYYRRSAAPAQTTAK